MIRKDSDVRVLGGLRLGDGSKIPHAEIEQTIRTVLRETFTHAAGGPWTVMADTAVESFWKGIMGVLGMTRTTWVSSRECDGCDSHKWPVLLLLYGECSEPGCDGLHLFISADCVEIMNELGLIPTEEMLSELRVTSRQAHADLVGREDAHVLH